MIPNEHQRPGSSTTSGPARLRRMSPVAACELPTTALLAAYQREGVYTDCFAVTVAGHVDFTNYVEAFYTTPLFKIERWLLGLFGYATSDQDARRLALGEVSRFSVWQVEARQPDQIMLNDKSGNTRSWFMIETKRGETTLYSGSAVVPAEGRSRIGIGYRALTGFHCLYSRALLDAAANRLPSARAGDD